MPLLCLRFWTQASAPTAGSLRGRACLWAIMDRSTGGEQGEGGQSGRNERGRAGPAKPPDPARAGPRGIRFARSAARGAAGPESAGSGVQFTHSASRNNLLRFFLLKSWQQARQSTKRMKSAARNLRGRRASARQPGPGRAAQKDTL